MAKKTKQLQLPQLEEFLGKVNACGAKFSGRQKKTLGKHFLEIVMVIKDEFVACKPGKESPDFEPRNKELYPWAFFVTDKEDLREEFDNRALQYLHGDNVGEEFHAVITNGKELCVFDFNHEVNKYTVYFDELLDGNKKTSRNWQAFLADFCVESAKGREQQYREKSIVDLPAKKEKRSTGRLKIDAKQNYVICGDCLDWLEDVPPASVDICYIDPPFFSNKNYEIIWGNGYERRSFEDRWKGGINAYIEWMEKRVKLIHSCLKDTGSIFLHCDWRASHRLRVMLDEVFGEKNFVNEIVWCYTGPSNSKNFFPRKHDIILFYSKKHVNFNCESVRIPYSNPKTFTMGGSGSLARKNKPKTTYKTGLEEALARGKIVEDYWIDIPSLSVSKERIGYKTQKPEALLERVIQCSTNEDDIVLDCFAGGGTTAVVAAKLNRKFIVGDVSPVAVRVISDRLNEIADDPKFEVLNVPRTAAEWLEMDGHTFAEKICSFMGWECNPKKSADGGVDGWANKRTIPVQIKNHKKSIGVNPIKNFSASLGKACEGIFVAWSFAKGAEEFRVQVKKDENKTITFITVEEILGSILIENEEKNMIDKLYKKYNKAA